MHKETNCCIQLRARRKRLARTQRGKKESTVVVSHPPSRHSTPPRHRVRFLLTRYVYGISIRLPLSVCCVCAPRRSAGIDASACPLTINRLGNLSAARDTWGQRPPGSLPTGLQASLCHGTKMVAGCSGVTINQSGFHKGEQTSLPVSPKVLRAGHILTPAQLELFLCR